MIVLDLILVILISVCIWYCWTLNQKIKDLQASKLEFMEVSKNFNAAVSQADQSIDKLNKAGNLTAEQLSSTIHKAEALNNDLVFINELGTSTANRLERNMTMSRKLKEGDKLEEAEESPLQSNAAEDAKSRIVQNNHQNKITPVIQSVCTADVGTDVGYTNNTHSYYDTLRKIRIKK